MRDRKKEGRTMMRGNRTRAVVLNTGQVGGAYGMVHSGMVNCNNGENLNNCADGTNVEVPPDTA